MRFIQFGEGRQKSPWASQALKAEREAELHGGQNPPWRHDSLQGSLHVGDVDPVEINGKSVTNHSVDQLQKILKETKGTVSLKVIPNQQNRVPALQDPVNECSVKDSCFRHSRCEWMSQSEPKLIWSRDPCLDLW
uniref:Uncharacterized protein n=1 Tax=Sphaerodactylus townsendi TaxID=933632 RepID=A0ACB8FWL9_9SAUR